MKIAVLLAGAGLPALLLAGLYGDTPDDKHAWAVHDMNRPLPAKVEVDGRGIPSDAIVLFDGTKESLDANWCDGKMGATKWFVRDGTFICPEGWTAIRTRREFGDCQLHIEFRHDPAKLFTDRGAQMRGNSGIFLMGTEYGYEVQVLESYYTSREAAGGKDFVANYPDGLAGAVYAENPPAVNPARKPGEWQVYDIVFHQPVWRDGKLAHPGSVTVFFNGVLVQDHWEMEGQTTHCRRRPLAPHPVRGPLTLQDHGCDVAFRNVWLRELPSRWDNLTHSAMSACPERVMEQRRATAKALYAKIADPAAATADNVCALAEVIAYANEGVWAEAFKRALAGYRAKPGDGEATRRVNDALGVLIRNGVLPADALVK